MFTERRRSGDFIERLSYVLIIGAFVGGYIVLLDIKFVLDIGDQIIEIGGDGFSPEVKGVVLQSMLISGFAAVVGFWLGTTKQGQEQARSVSKIAEAAAPATAKAVAAATGQPAPADPGAPIVAENVNVQAETATLTEKGTTNDDVTKKP